MDEITVDFIISKNNKCDILLYSRLPQAIGQRISFWESKLVTVNSLELKFNFRFSIWGFILSIVLDQVFITNWLFSIPVFILLSNNQSIVLATGSHRKKHSICQLANSNWALHDDIYFSTDGHEYSDTKDDLMLHTLASHVVWPDWAIYWTLDKFWKPLATIHLPKSPTLLGNFCKGVWIYHFSCDIIFAQPL